MFNSKVKGGLVNKIILPTDDIVEELASVECLFVFYRNGIKGIIEDLMVDNNKNKIDEIINCYNNTPLGRFYHFTDNAFNDFIIEIYLELIHTQLKNILRMIFYNTSYSIRNHNFKWVGNNIVIDVDVYGVTHGKHTRHPNLGFRA